MPCYADDKTYPFKSVPSRWKDDIEFARLILTEAGIIYREVDAMLAERAKT